jgi:hypothetical protein
MILNRLPAKNASPNKASGKVGEHLELTGSRKTGDGMELHRKWAGSAPSAAFRE